MLDQILMQRIIQRYLEYTKDERNSNANDLAHMQHLKNEAAFMVKEIELLENSQRKLLGQNLGPCSMVELHEVENHLERSLKNIRTRKSQVFNQQMERLQAKEESQLKENARLREKIGLMMRGSAPNVQKQIGNHSRSTQSSEVETELFIGPPATKIGF